VEAVLVNECFGEVGEVFFLQQTGYVLQLLAGREGGADL
jgi:hypothetical protein